MLKQVQGTCADLAILVVEGVDIHIFMFLFSTIDKLSCALPIVMLSLLF